MVGRLITAFSLDTTKTPVVLNRALELGDELTLIRLGLDPTRIADLEQRHKAGKKGFPDYVIRNLSNTIQHLQEYRRAFSQHRLNKDEQADKQ
ncbi:hypothetical protein BKM25_23140 [Pseudomonas avellanae]|nr:hypothetical protein AO261_26560 [Pseudomonas avellanae]POR73169.1 hypothetical protein BKM25_23140 [Pseudomonas avellanae]